jgi:hypothetical protein
MMPSTMIIELTVMLSRYTPNSGIRNTVPRSDTGMPSATQNAVRTFRKRERRMSTNASPIRPFERTMWSLLRT